MPSLRVIAGLLALNLTVAGAAALALHDEPAPRTPSAAPVRGRATPLLQEDRASEVRALLDRRAAAMRTRNREAWIATVDPANPPLVQRQAALFDALTDVPVRDWTYSLDPAAPPPGPVQEPDGWAPGVTLTYRIAGFDTRPTIEPEHLTFVPRGGSWYLASDDDFAALGKDTTRGLWDGGPVSVVRGARCLVLGHPSSRETMRQVAGEVDAAIPRVTSAWGPNWAQKVVLLVPSTEQELARIVGHGGFDQIAAVATAELTDGANPVGDRVIVNPGNFAKLGELGRRVVLTHEVTHVATRSATGASAPSWLVEGFADYVGYSGLELPYDVSAAELRSAVRRGAVPAALPSDADFQDTNKNLSTAYEEAWLAVTLLAEQHGRAGLLRLYRAVGRGTSVAAALRSLFGTTAAAFTASWRRDLVGRLS